MMNILQMSITAGLLIIAVVIIRAIALNKLPKKMFIVLWGVALFRLLVPVSIPLPFNVPNVYNVLLPATVEQFVIENPVNTGQIITSIAEISEVTEQTTATTPIINIAPTTAIWLLGMLLLFIFFAIVYFKNHRELRFATLIRDNEFLSEWLVKHKTKRVISILQSDRITTPIAVGVFNPRIILPMLMNMDDTQLLEYVLAHEYYHIKRFDALLKMLFAFVLCVHWFNPLVWVMFILVNRDLELACDEKVIRSFGAETKTAYAYTLIGMVEQKAKFTPLYNSFSKNAVEERIVSVMKVKRVSVFGVITACLLVSVLTFGALATYASGKPHIEIEWWTYEEYRAYFETEKSIYELSDVSIRHTEERIEEIRNGAKYSNIIRVNGEEITDIGVFAVPTDVAYFGVGIGFGWGELIGRFYSADDFLTRLKVFYDEHVLKGAISQSEADLQYAIWEAANK
jgi:beta-lactamase regulating signal transducer with metallopeptidase domain